MCAKCAKKRRKNNEKRSFGSLSFAAVKPLQTYPKTAFTTLIVSERFSRTNSGTSITLGAATPLFGIWQSCEPNSTHDRNGVLGLDGAPEKGVWG